MCFPLGFHFGIQFSGVSLLLISNLLQAIELLSVQLIQFGVDIYSSKSVMTKTLTRIGTYI